MREENQDWRVDDEEIMRVERRKFKRRLGGLVISSTRSPRPQ